MSMSTDRKYVWDERLGVAYMDGSKKHPYRHQAIQLLHGPASLSFRRKCGKLLVEALNRGKK